MERTTTNSGINRPLTGQEPPDRDRPDRVGERRQATRFALVLHAARLVADGREYICLPRDISATGVRIKLFHALPTCASLQLELMGGNRHEMIVVWDAGNHAGLSFSDAVGVIAPAAGIAHLGRPLRIVVDQLVGLRLPGQSHRARLVNLSQHGACIETDVSVGLHEPLQIENKQMREIYATVCWCDQFRYGLVFDQAFKLDRLARLLERLWRSDPRREHC